VKVVPGGIPRYGVRLGDANFGDVVLRPEGGTFYLVASPMNGTGHRVLVTLEGGTLKTLPQDTRVIPVEAAVYVGGPSSENSSSDRNRDVHRGVGTHGRA